MSHSVHIRLNCMMPWSAALLVPMVLAGCSQSGAATPDAKPAAKTPAATQPAKQPTAGQAKGQAPTTARASARGSWYMSTNATASNWSKTGMFYEKPWEDHLDAGNNTTLELYVKALTPHTIEVFNAGKLSIGIDVHPDATHTALGGGVTLGNYVQLTDQNWTRVSIPLADFKGLNFHEVYFFPCLPQALGTGDYSLGIDEIRFVGGSSPVVFYGDAHPNNPITTHGAGMEAHFVTTGGVDVDGTAARK
jgi:hypothetical protein